jgi:hypothetical protein
MKKIAAMIAKAIGDTTRPMIGAKRANFSPCSTMRSICSSLMPSARSPSFAQRGLVVEVGRTTNCTATASSPSAPGRAPGRLDGDVGKPAPAR